MIAVALALLGCPKSTPIINPVDWEEMPRLPSPTAGSYAQVPGVPPDPGVRAVLGGHPWDASLGGAAAGIALDLVYRRGGLTAPEIREAAWRAGWPYPIRSVHTVGAAIGAPAPQAIRALLSTVPSEARIGLVRARGDQQDLWVMLTSVPRIELEVYPRQLPTGARLKLNQAPGVAFAVSDPHGELYEGHLEVEWSVAANVVGEWLIELRDEQGLLARFPIYVGMLPPELSLLGAGEPPLNEPYAAEQAHEILSRVRDAYGLRPPQVDSLLQTAVPWAQLNPNVLSTTIASRVGVEPADLWRFECTDATVEVCLDPIVWDPRARPALLADRLLLGIGADLAPNGVHMTLLLARE